MTLGAGLFAFILGLVALSMGSQWLMDSAARRAEGTPAPSLPGELGEAVRGDVVVWFHAPSCAPCRSMQPAVEQLGGRARMVDVSRDLPIAQAFGVMATPTTVVIRDGQVQHVRVGPLSAADLTALLAPSS